MAALRRNPSPSPSLSSNRSDVSSDLSAEEHELRALAKKKLAKRLFIGHYQERRYVEPMRVYRDMVIIHRSEAELQHDLDQVKVKLSSYYPSTMWIGITSPHTIGAPAAGYCLWVKLQDVAFGYYWFQIKQVRYRDNEIILRLSIVRPIIDEVVCPQTAPISLSQTLSSNMDALKSKIKTSIHSLTDVQPSPCDSAKVSQINSSESESKPETAKPTNLKQSDSESQVNESENMSSKVRNRKSESNDSNETSEIGSSCDTSSLPTKSDTLEWKDIVILLQWCAHNWREFFRFLVTLLMGLASCVSYVGDFSLRFMREVTFFLRTVTPIILAVIELVGKLIGGLYLLLAMTFNKRPGPPIPPGTFYSQKPMRAIQQGRPGPRPRYVM